MRPEVTTIKARFPGRRYVLSGLVAMAAASVLPGRARAAEEAPIGYMKPDEAHKAAQAGDIILVDIRTPEEWRETRVAEGAVALDMTSEDFVANLVALRQANPQTPIAMICRTGSRTEYVTTALAKQGFPGLVDVREGMVGGPNGPGWLKRGLPTYEGSPAMIDARRAKVLP